MRVLCHWLGSLVGSWEGGCSGGGCGGGSGRADNFEWDGAVGSDHAYWTQEDELIGQ